jgi:hypothetical protein
LTAEPGLPFPLIPSPAWLCKLARLCRAAAKNQQQQKKQKFWRSANEETTNKQTNGKEKSLCREKERNDVNRIRIEILIFAWSCCFLVFCFYLECWPANFATRLPTVAGRPARWVRSTATDLRLRSTAVPNCPFQKINKRLTRTF